MYDSDGAVSHFRRMTGISKSVEQFRSCSARTNGLQYGIAAQVDSVTTGQRRFPNPVRNCLDCVKSRALPAANADIMARAHIACHAAAIAYRLGRKVRFDPAKEEFIGDEEANRMRTRSMREPCTV